MDKKKLRERLARVTPYLLALLTAILLRLIVDNLYGTERRIEVPLSVKDLPAQWTVVSGLPQTVSVKLTGDKNALEGPDLESKLKAWVVLGRPVEGTNVSAVKIGDSGLPFNVNFNSVTPVKVRVLLAAPTNSPAIELSTTGAGNTIASNANAGKERR